tara:strand:- start:186 stop:839 length:654 start_codon:yes stop_codon:yes gene_type:complete
MGTKLMQYAYALVTVLSLLLAQGAHAQIAAELTEPQDSAYVRINVGIETAGLTLAADRMILATQELAKSIRLLAENPNMSAEQQQLLGQTLLKVGEISTSVNHTLAELPKTMQEVVDRNREPVFSLVEGVGNQVTTTLAILGLLLILLLAVVLGLVYQFILKPIQSAMVTTSNNLSVLSQSLQHTAQLVDGIQQQQPLPLPTIRKGRFAKGRYQPPM